MSDGTPGRDEGRAPRDAPARKLLVVDDDPGVLALLARTLERAGFSCDTAGKGADAADRLAGGTFDLLIVDFKLPDIGARELIDHLSKEGTLVPFVVVTGQGDERVAVDMMKRGARDYLIKDHGLLERLVPVVERALEQVEQEKRLADAERAVREKENLARLGEMAAVVAHEVKNPLAAMSGALQVIRGQMPAEGGQVGIIDEILSRVESLSRSVDEILLFARPPSLRLAPVRIRGLIDDTVALLLQDPTHASLRVRIEGDDIELPADAGILKRAFLNLLINAAQAAEGEGEGGGGEVRVRIERRGDCCRVAVIDDGPGIPREIERSLFRPFATTKARGTGLGLATARQIIERHGGSIRVRNAARGGAEAVVELPLTS